jgi:hypothetical protein
MSLTLFCSISEQNDIANVRLQSFLQFGRGALLTYWPEEVVAIKGLNEFDYNDRFFTTSCNQYMGHSLRLLYTFHLKRTQSTAIKKNA